ncbi:MAG TPA: SRPBCC domain-containing protein [Steroidobacteraceae bacterium]|nr:SRPBCC domain-containing protein [Steroidobacteraceae bacterium]
MSGRTRGYAHRVDIAAGASQVWKALTDNESLRKWCSPEAQISAREGGHFRASVDRVIELEAHIDVLLPERRMRLIYLPSQELPQNGSPIVDDFILDGSDASVTILRLLGSGFPTSDESDRLYLRLRTGWQRAVARLKVLVEKTAKDDG